MARRSANGTAGRQKAPAPTRHELAAEADGKRAQWMPLQGVETQAPG